MDLKRKQDIRSFSIEHGQERRNKVAGEIREQRKKNFDRKQQLHDAIEELLEKIKEKELDVEQVVEEISGFQEYILNMESFLIQKFLKYFEIKHIQETLQEKEEQKSELVESYTQMKMLLDELQMQRENRSELEEAKNILDKFYHEENERWGEYKEEEKARSVEEIIREYDNFFVHGINPKYVPLLNSMLNRGVEWQKKLRILLSLEPSLSTSTIESGDDYTNIWSRMGVVLNGGRVAGAHPLDAGTQATSLNNRIGITGNSADIEKDIKRAISEKNRYNEFVLEQPQVAGFYVCIEDIGGEQKDLVDFSEIYLETQELDMPLFVLEHGEMYEAIYDEQSNRLTPGKKVSPQEMLTTQYDLSEDRRNELVDEILTDSPFKIKSPELQYIDSRSTGQQTYLELLQPKDGNEVVYEQDKRNVGTARLEQGDSLTLISKVEGPSEVVRYFSQDGKIIRERVYRGKEEAIIDILDRKESLSSVKLGIFFIEPFERGLKTTDDYLQGMREKLIELRKEIEEEDEDAFRKKLLGMYAFHIYGFMEEAKKHSDEDAVQKAFVLANEFFSGEYYNEIIARRIDDKGRFKITKDEIE
ncbi:MAG: hypothetical protein HOE80_03515 [Candidatus Magasanikbacteria bacterium]|nr:hypothetical protein [Candidatus Magasanikbacteria bacterium]